MIAYSRAVGYKHAVVCAGYITADIALQKGMYAPVLADDIAAFIHNHVAEVAP